VCVWPRCFGAKAAARCYMPRQPIDFTRTPTVVHQFSRSISWFGSFFIRIYADSVSRFVRRDRRNGERTRTNAHREMYQRECENDHCFFPELRIRFLDVALISRSTAIAESILPDIFLLSRFFNISLKSIFRASHFSKRERVILPPRKGSRASLRVSIAKCTTLSREDKWNFSEKSSMNAKQFIFFTSFFGVSFNFQTSVSRHTRMHTHTHICARIQLYVRWNTRYNGEIYTREII